MMTSAYSVYCCIFFSIFCIFSVHFCILLHIFFHILHIFLHIVSYFHSGTQLWHQLVMSGMTNFQLLIEQSINSSRFKDDQTITVTCKRKIYLM